MDAKLQTGNPSKQGQEGAGKLHLLRGFVQWMDRNTATPIKTVTQAEQWVNHIAACGFDRFYTWTTRRPRRTEALQGGSVFFVGGERRAQALFRMPLVEIEENDNGFAICMRPKIIRVERRFVGRVRGWRYLTEESAPPDLPQHEYDGDIPEDLAQALDEFGVR